VQRKRGPHQGLPQMLRLSSPRSSDSQVLLQSLNRPSLTCLSLRKASIKKLMRAAKNRRARAPPPSKDLESQ